MDKKNIVEQIRRTALSKKENSLETISHLYVPTGSVLLNLACSNSINGGYGVGRMVNIIGDSSSGKTMLALSCCAEMSQLSTFDKYSFYYDDVEAALGFDLQHMFGRKAADRINMDRQSSTIQSFQDNVISTIKEGTPFVYILDSFDALTSEEEETRVEDASAARQKGKQVKGSYRAEKPKIIGEILRQIVRELKKTMSLLIIVSQVRDNFDPMSYQKKTRAGGHALRFYASHEIWLFLHGKIKSKERIIGNDVKAKVAKNKLTGNQRDVEFPIYTDYGVDNIESSINFLVNEEYWVKQKNSIVAEELGHTASISKLIEIIETESMEKELFNTVQRCWNDIEDSLKLKRKPKYGD